jgi:hypothetical protein
MAKRKTGRGGCPLRVALDVFGGEDALRKEADHRATWSLWKTQEAVPWAVVGPVLLERWREATHGRGLVPIAMLNSWREGVKRHIDELQRMKDEEEARMLTVTKPLPLTKNDTAHLAEFLRKRRRGG